MKNKRLTLRSCFCLSVAKLYLTLRPHDLQHTRLPCPSLSPGVCSNSCPLSRWCYPTISSSVAPLSSCPQSFPESRSFPMSWLFASGGQIIGSSASVLSMNIQGWFILGLTGLISLQFKGLSRVFSSTTIWKNLFSLFSLLHYTLAINFQSKLKDFKWKNEYKRMLSCLRKIHIVFSSLTIVNW